MVILNEFHEHKYDVFLSFRATDTRLSFTNHLYTALENANLRTFLDDEEIEIGKDLKPELEDAIKASRASIIVLSKNYASSIWCLEELVLILEQYRNSNHIVFPIFYHVEPTHVRNQQSTFGDAMAKHKLKMKEETNTEKRSQSDRKVEVWNRALTEVANLKGKDVSNRKETEFIQEIVRDIHHILGVPLKTTLPALIGAEDHIEFLTSWLKDGSLNTASILTILGMSGIGKTSLAKYVYGLFCREFNKCSFIEDISRRCEQNGLLDIQKQLCDDISQMSSIPVQDVFVYTSLIENTLACKKVFLVLDDIGSLDQLNALLGNKYFHPESRVIITTKDGSLTERWVLFDLNVQPMHTQVLLDGLYETEALELLCTHAFKGQKPKQGYEEVSKKLVKYCEGHPLALKVLGESLRNQTVNEWEYYIDGLKKEPHSRIMKALKMSFDSLPFEKDKVLFKHIACFFVGQDRDLIETRLEACDIQTRPGIRNLTDRCLLSIRWNNQLMMHQLIQEMGRDLIRQESPEKPWKRTRLWCHEESFKVLKHKKGKGNLLGLALDMRMLDKKKLRGSLQLKTDCSSHLESLMLLQLNYVKTNGFLENIPEELKWLCLHGFPLKSIPSDLAMEYLVVLDMSYSSIESFGMFYSSPQLLLSRKKKLTESCSPLLASLKILDLSFCKQLLSLGGFIELPALERLLVKDCISLIEVCRSIEQCVELVLVDMSYCHKIKNLPILIGKLRKVKTLFLDGCNTNEPQTEMRDLDSSSYIGINSQAPSTLIKEVIPIDLKSLATYLPMSLVTLSLIGNNMSIESFPNDLSSLSVLKKLYLDGNPIVAMPTCVRSLQRLEELSMIGCNVLTLVENPPHTLRRLSINHMSFIKSLVRKIVFDLEMSPLNLYMEKCGSFPHSSFQIDGIIKTQPVARIEEKVLHRLGWTNLEFLKKRFVGTYDNKGVPQGSQTQMYYEFGIFSTVYGGKVMPNWIRRRRKGPSISFTITSSPKKLRGLNICFVNMLRSSNRKSHWLPKIKVNNITKGHTWVYSHCIDRVNVGGKCLTYLSHWMFGMNEMENGDHVTISVTENEYEWRPKCRVIRECGVRVVYDDRNMEEDEEDVLGYYKSWNHIIGGDLSSFQVPGSRAYILNSHNGMLNFKDFKAFSQGRV